MSARQIKRFWARAAPAPAPGGGLHILLDGKPLRLPGQAPLLLRSPKLAAAIAAEWQQAGGGIDGVLSDRDTPLTALASMAEGRIAADPAPVVAALSRYGETDLLCYRADPASALGRVQLAAWQPWLDWAAAELGANLRVGFDLKYLPQDPAALAALQRAVVAQRPGGLAVLGVAVPALGSLVLGLALVHGALDAGIAHDLGSLDERHQAQFWGEDPEAAARRAAIGAELRLAEEFLRLQAAG